MTRDFYGGCVKLKIPVTKDMQVAKFLVDDSEVGEWTLQVPSPYCDACMVLTCQQAIAAMCKLDITGTAQQSVCETGKHQIYIFP